MTKERETYRLFGELAPPMQMFMQGRDGADTAINRGIRPVRSLQPGNTMAHVLRPAMPFGYPTAPYVPPF